MYHSNIAVAGQYCSTVSRRAEALRRSTLALMETTVKPYYTLPLFWAPFIIVDERARQ